MIWCGLHPDDWWSVNTGYGVRSRSHCESPTDLLLVYCHMSDVKPHWQTKTSCFVSDNLEPHHVHLIDTLSTIKILMKKETQHYIHYISHVVIQWDLLYWMHYLNMFNKYLIMDLLIHCFVSWGWTVQTGWASEPASQRACSGGARQGPRETARLPIWRCLAVCLLFRTVSSNSSLSKTLNPNCSWRAGCPLACLTLPSVCQCVY